MRLTVKNLMNYLSIDKYTAIAINEMYKDYRKGEITDKAFFEKADQMLEFFGIEYLSSVYHYNKTGISNYAMYINTGYTYKCTLIRDFRYCKRMIIDSMGNFYEKTYYNVDNKHLEKIYG
ncbi:MAG: hypothetical protein WC877_00445 [Dehalococcoidales bacterium]|jgi:hypothetical protein